MSIDKDFELMNKIVKHESQMTPADLGNRAAMNDIENAKKIKAGDFISVTNWKTFGCVTEILLPEYGSENVQCVLLQEYPDSNKTTKYHLEPGDYTIED